ncbi:unnamed protein product [Cunninghamella blakesleeana]
MGHIYSIFVLLFLSYSTLTLAIYESQAGVFDWHHSWIGKPQWVGEYKEHISSHIIISTERNVLAFLNSSSGAIEWRQVLNAPIYDPHLIDDGLLTISKSPSVIQFWGTTNGKLKWEHTLKDINNKILGGNKDIVITQKSILKFNTGSGDIQWEIHRPNVVNSSWMHTHDLNDRATTFLIEHTYEDSKPLIHVNGIDVLNGKFTQSFTFPGHSTQPIIHGGYLLWIDKYDKTLKWNLIGSKKVQSFSLKTLSSSLPSFDNVDLENGNLITLNKPLDNNDIFFVYAPITDIYGDITSQSIAALAISEDGKSINVVDDLGTSEASFGSISKTNNNIYRFSVQTPKSTDVLIQKFYNHKHITHNDYSNKLKLDTTLSGNIDISTFIDDDLVFITTDSGSVYMYNMKSLSLVWSREEALAHTTAVEVIDLPEKQTWNQVDETSYTSSLSRYLYRLSNHVISLQQLPNWLIHHFVEMGKSISSKNSNSSKKTPIQSQASWSGDDKNSENLNKLYRDPFGMHKIIISVTSTGKIIAQDSSNHGKIIWTRYINGVSFNQLFVVRTSAVGLAPLIVAIGTTESTTHLYRLNGLTGLDYHTSNNDIAEHFEPVLVTDIPFTKVMMLPIEEPDEHSHIIALYDEASTRVYIYPDTLNSKSTAASFWSHFYFQSTSKKALDESTVTMLNGYRVREGYRGSLTASPVWNLQLPVNEQIVAVNEYHHSNMNEYGNAKLSASLGRVLGNRNVYYKYLNPNIMAFITGNTQSQTLKIRIIDIIKGSILYEAAHHQVSSFDQAHLIQVENWIIYHFWSNEGKNTGHQVVVLELYEGDTENQRITSTNFSSFDFIKPSTQSNAYVFPFNIEAMGVTVTKNGVSTRDILFALSSHQIFSVNKRFFDPRRPVLSNNGKLSKDEQEEQLFPYGPIPDEKKWFLSYDLEILGIKHIVSYPALLESTSLIYAYGLDTFFTYDSPSRQFDVLSEDFSKSQLLLTISALVIGITITSPIVKRKQVSALWK